MKEVSYHISFSDDNKIEKQKTIVMNIEDRNDVISNSFLKYFFDKKIEKDEDEKVLALKILDKNGHVELDIFREDSDKFGPAVDGKVNVEVIFN